MRTWVDYLVSAGVDVADGDFYQAAECWRGVTFGLVAGFKAWLLQPGFAIASVNRRLSCVRKFCALGNGARAWRHRRANPGRNGQLDFNRDGQALHCRESDRQCRRQRTGLCLGRG
ncbi:MAG: hypothetical protein HC802_07170 [Caldilineaceae bacterium]|nr:hypothetical protein [Caldilineaceae bacterium]